MRRGAQRGSSPRVARATSPLLQEQAWGRRSVRHPLLRRPSQLRTRAWRPLQPPWTKGLRRLPLPRNAVVGQAEKHCHHRGQAEEHRPYGSPKCSGNACASSKPRPARPASRPGRRCLPLATQERCGRRQGDQASGHSGLLQLHGVLYGAHVGRCGLRGAAAQAWRHARLRSTGARLRSTGARPRSTSGRQVPLGREAPVDAELMD